MIANKNIHVFNNKLVLLMIVFQMVQWKAYTMLSVEEAHGQKHASTQAENNQVLNLESFQEGCGSDMVFVLETLDIYLEESGAYLEQLIQLTQCYESENHKEISRLIHELKGSSATIYAEEVKEQCISLEDDLKNNQVDDIGEKIQSITSAFKRVKEFTVQLHEKDNESFSCR